MEKSQNQKRILWVAEAALMLALIVVAQLLTFVVPKSIPLVSQLLTGSLVNLILIVGAGSVGFSGTAVAAVLSPVLALLMGQMTFPQMVPVVSVGNLIIVAVTWAFFSRNIGRSKGIGPDIAGIIVGAAAKTLFLWAATTLIIIPLFFTANQIVASKLSLMFSWPQGITAIIGGIIALIVLPPVRTYRKRRV